MFSGKTKNDLIEFGYLSYLKNKYRNFDFKYTLTQEESELTGRIPTILSDLYPDLSNYNVYIAGSTGFVDSCKEKVVNLGGKDDQIFIEGFTPQ